MRLLLFAAAALADDGVGQQQRLEMAAVSERLFQLRHRRRQRGRCRTFSRHTGGDSLADTAEVIARPAQNLLARNMDTPEMTFSQHHGDDYRLSLPRPDAGT